MNNKIPAFVYFILFLIILGFGAFQFMRPWKIYTNIENGFTVRVPANLEVNNMYSDYYRSGWIGNKIEFTGNFNEAYVSPFPSDTANLVLVNGYTAHKSKHIPRTMGMGPSEEVLRYDFIHNGKRIAFTLHSIGRSDMTNYPFGKHWSLNSYEVYIFEKIINSLQIH